MGPNGGSVAMDSGTIPYIQARQGSPGQAVGGFVVYVFSTYVLTHTMTMAHRIYKLF
jgi:hypothetical protein